MCPSTPGTTQPSARPAPDLPALPRGAGVPGGDPAAREDGAVEQDGDSLPGEPSQGARPGHPSGQRQSDMADEGAVVPRHDQ